MGRSDLVQAFVSEASMRPLQSRRRRRRVLWCCAVFLLGFTVCWQAPSLAHDEAAKPYVSTPMQPAPQESPMAKPAIPDFPAIKKLRDRADQNARMDEALGGKTLHGTPIWPRTAECFPAESRDIFWEMDRVPDGSGGPLRSLNFDKNNDGKLQDVSPREPHSDNERDAIRGRNTWILWAAGNEGFWNWLAQDGYGFTDLLVAIDSRNRASRFQRMGVINQPGFVPNGTKRVLGLYLDLPAPGPNGSRMKPAPWDEDHRRPSPPPDHRGFKLFEPAKTKEHEYEDAVAALAAMDDGVDPDIYGYPSGVVGLRLFLNPDYFADTPAASKAREYWNKQIVSATSDRFYSDPAMTADPTLVRPFRVGMSCGFCHVGPHPLNPPKDPEAPQWENLSSIIGNQYWRPQPLFANRLAPSSFLYHFLLSQQPGTIDTSLISTDQINNSNTINAVFEVNARLKRARVNPREKQSNANLRQPNIEDQLPALLDPDQIDEDKRMRHTARILLDGADSIGAFGALTRVYLNIGSFYEQWNRCQNPIIGFGPQRPFSVEVCQRNSVYWQATEKYRAHYLADFFTMLHEPVASSAESKYAPPPASQYHDACQAMHLQSAKDGDGQTTSRAATTALQLDSPEQRNAGRRVWLGNCAICHSSKQPDGFGLTFDRMEPGKSWETAEAPKGASFVLPMDFKDWEDFKRSASYKKYQALLDKLVLNSGNLDGDPLTDGHEFWRRNYLSTDIRVPLTLVATNPGRALGTNGIGGHVWDNFTSDTYKALPAVGALDYVDVVTGETKSFKAPGGGVGYYRPATHVSLWSTAPYLHNNAMGFYLDDPSVKGRLVQFLDSMRRMLWLKQRASKTLVLSDQERQWLETLQKDDATSPRIDPDRLFARAGDLRISDPSLAGRDPGFVYRVPNDTYFEIPVAYTRNLIEGVAGPTLTWLLAGWGLLLAALLLLYLAGRVRPRSLGVWLVFLALLTASLLALTGLGGTPGTQVGVILLGLMDLLHFSSLTWWLLVLGLAAYGLALILVEPDNSSIVRWIVTLTALAVVLSIWIVGGPALLALLVALIVVAIVWRWNPTLSAFTRAMFVVIAVAAAIGSYASYRFVNGKSLATLPGVNVVVGPIPIKLGPIPRGVPLNLLMNLDPDSPHFTEGVLKTAAAITDIKRRRLDGKAAYDAFMEGAGEPLVAAAKCPDFQLDRGHLFGEALTDEEKESLIAFLKTL